MKRIIMVAALVISANMIGIANAEEASLDFDGSGAGVSAASIMREAKDTIVCKTVCEASGTCHRVCTSVPGKHGFDAPKVSSPREVTSVNDLRHLVVGLDIQTADVNTEHDNNELARLDESINSAIKYATNFNSEKLASSLKELLNCGSRIEKYGFVYAGKETYTIPTRIAILAEVSEGSLLLKSIEKRTSAICVRGHYETNCISKKVCATEPACDRVCSVVSGVACTAAAAGTTPAVGAGVGIGCGIVANEVCNWVCEMKETCQVIEECKDVFVCDSFETIGNGNGSAVDAYGNVVAHQ